MKNILFVASEGVPFIKTGGLADVVGSLPKEIDKNYYDVRVFLPKYSCIRQEMKDRMEYITSFYMDFDWKSMYVGILKAEANGVIKSFSIPTSRTRMTHFSKSSVFLSSRRQFFPLCRRSGSVRI